MNRVDAQLDVGELTSSQLRKLKLVVDLADVESRLRSLRSAEFDGSANSCCDNRDVLKNAFLFDTFVNEYVNGRLAAKEAEKARQEQERARFQREERFRRLVSLFVVAAKMAKADGRVDASEVKVVERLFIKFGIKSEERKRYVDAFNAAVKTEEDIHSYAYKIANSFPLETRMFIYELLWDVACADGVLVEEERVLLKKLQCEMGLAGEIYLRYLRSRASYYRAKEQKNQSSSNGTGAGENKNRSGSNQRGTPMSVIENAYSLIGGNAEMSNDELKSAYRLQAKAYHPDVLRAKGIPEDMIAFANAKMIKLNDAWTVIRKARGI